MASDFVLFAHRGASAYAPENTMAAFCRAVEMGCPGIELDVRLTKDGVPAVMHDETVDRTTDGEGRVDSLSWAELKELDAGGWFAGEYAGERVPQLGEVLKFAAGKARPCIEIKGRSGEEALCEKVVTLIHGRDMRDEVLVSSFSQTALRTVRGLDVSLRTSLLVGRGSLDESTIAAACELGAAAVSAHASVVKADIVELAHARGLLAFAWATSSVEEEISALMDTGIDGMTSNWPDVALRVLAARARP